jgi:hypothetical protein
LKIPCGKILEKCNFIEVFTLEKCKKGSKAPWKSVKKRYKTPLEKCIFSYLYAFISEKYINPAT